MTSASFFIFIHYYVHGHRNCLVLFVTSVSPLSILTMQVADPISEEIYDDEDDENDENNWRNDYPDEDEFLPEENENSDREKGIIVLITAFFHASELVPSSVSASAQQLIIQQKGQWLTFSKASPLYWLQSYRFDFL